MKEEQSDIKKITNHLQRRTEDIDFDTPVEKRQELDQYLNYYGLPNENVTYHFGNLHVDNYHIKIQMYSPIHCTKSEVVLLLHGYLDHAGVLGTTIRFLTDEGYSVITFDWPGHGLSSGERAGITHFDEYQAVYESVVRKVRQQFNSSLHVIAHSTGAAVVVNHLLTRKDQLNLASIILVAPLIRSNLWTITKFGYYFMSPIIKKVKRVIRENSSDKQFIEFIKKDPCQPTNVPLNWLKALIDWNEQIHTVESSDHRVLVLQGINDETVDWDYNCRFIANKFKNSEILLYDKGKHHLLNETKGIRVSIFKQIVEELKGNNRKLHEIYNK